MFLSYVWFFLSNIQPIREYIWTVCKKVVKSKLHNCGFNTWELAISRPYINLTCLHTLVNRTHKGFVKAILYPKSQLYWQLHLLHLQNIFYRIVLVSQKYSIAISERSVDTIGKLELQLWTNSNVEFTT